MAPLSAASQGLDDPDLLIIMNDLRQEADLPCQTVVPHRAWLRARRDLAAALSSGADMILVLGGPGTGKSLLLAELAALLAVGDVAARVRTPSVPRRADCQIDIVDAVDLAALGAFAADPAPPRLRIVAVRTGGTGGATLGALSPRLRVIELGPLDTGDVQTVIDARLVRWGLAKTALTARACAKIRKVSAGNPAAVDQIISRAIRLAIDSGSPRVLGEHVDRATAPDGPPPVRQATRQATRQADPPPEPAPPAAVPLPPSEAEPTRQDSGPATAPVYRSMIEELAAMTAVAMEAAEARRTMRRRRYGMAAALLGTAAIGALSVTGTDRLSSALLSAQSGFLRIAKKSLPGPGLLAIRQ